MASVRQIAKMAGVAPCTVSRALRDDPHVLPETRQRIMAIAEKMHYTTLRGGARQRGVIGCLIPTVDMVYPAMVLNGAMEYAFAEGYRLFTLQTHHQFFHACCALDVFIQDKVEGVILFGCHPEPVTRELIFRLTSNNIVPMALDQTEVDTPIDTVGTDEMQLAELAVDYLYSLGHRAIAFVGDVSEGETVMRRTHAMMTTFRRYGLDTKYIWYMKENSADKARTIIDAMLGSTPRPTAIIAGQDTRAAILMQVLAARGVKVPQDMSVLGCGNMDFSPLLTPALTTVEQFPAEIGRQAVALLLQRITERISADQRQPLTISIAPELVLRNSCAPAR